MKPFRFLDPTLLDQMPHSLCALAVMTKAPQAGRVKTRLVPPLTPREAAELNKCFLRDTTATISNACSRFGAYRAPRQYAARGIAVYTPTGSESAYKNILPSDFSLLPQRGDKFGERLYFAFEDLFKCGFESVCLIDSDSPTVPPANFEQAVRLLASTGNRIVLGPSDDGGYYLIGLRKLHREVFEEIDWSTERVLNQTIQRAAGIGLEVKLLSTGYDVDDGESLRRLCNELLANTSRKDLAPYTQKFLRELAARKKL
jgi:rSAM/selenodomain-associated transferase 1